MYGYIAALVLSGFTLIMTMCRILSDLGDYVFTDKKTYVCIIASAVFLVVGLIEERIEREKIE